MRRQYFIAIFYDTAGRGFRLVVVLSFMMLFGLLAGCSGGGGAVTFWVSPDGNDTSPGTASAPFLTLERARDAIRSLGAAERNRDISVYLRGGTYRLKQPLVLDWRDSGSDGHIVTYRAVPGEQPVLSGGLRVTGWTLYNRELGIYRARVGQVDSRQLYVNGRRAVRARTSSYPAGFRPSSKSGIEFIPTDLNPAGWRDPSRWTNPQDVEAVMVTQWKMMRVPLASVVPYPGHVPDPLLHPEVKTGLLTIRQPAWNNANVYWYSELYGPASWSFWQVTWFENALEFLDEPGEWYLDKTGGWLYYLPRPGEDLAMADAELAVIETLVEGRGEPDRPIQNISFEGLTFAYATWLGPNSGDGYVADQSGFRLLGPNHLPNTIGHDPDVVRTPGNVRFGYARNITFRRNAFVHLGGVGLDLDAGSQSTAVSDNLFLDISSAAIQLGGVSPIDHHPGQPGQITRDNVISNNLIKQTGREYVDAAGIYVGFTKGTLLSHNTIMDVPWSGIAVGWGWGLLDPGMFPGLPNARRGQWGTFDTPTPNSGNRILNNRIQQFLGVNWDGGAIYTTGWQGTSLSDPLLIEGNVAFGKRPAAGGNVFYTDGGSRYVVLRGNVSFDNPQGVTDLGPPSNPADPLPYAAFSALSSIPYGGDSGGCVTYGDIIFTNNYWSGDRYFNICPYVEGGVSYPTNLSYDNNRIIKGPADVPQSIIDASGVQNFPKALLDAAGIEARQLF